MKIHKHGRVLALTCDKCGCSFMAGINECQNCGFFYKVACPDCGSNVESKASPREATNEGETDELGKEV